VHLLWDIPGEGNPKWEKAYLRVGCAIDHRTDRNVNKVCAPSKHPRWEENGLIWYLSSSARHLWRSGTARQPLNVVALIMCFRCWTTQCLRVNEVINIWPSRRLAVANNGGGTRSLREKWFQEWSWRWFWPERQQPEAQATVMADGFDLHGFATYPR